MKDEHFEKLSALIASKGVHNDAFELLADLRKSERMYAQEVPAIINSIVVALEGCVDYENQPANYSNYLQAIRRLQEDKAEDNMPHVVSEVICVKCAYRWIAARPEVVMLKHLECANCGVGAVIETGQVIADKETER